MRKKLYVYHTECGIVCTCFNTRTEKAEVVSVFYKQHHELVCRYVQQRGLGHYCPPRCYLRIVPATLCRVDEIAPPERGALQE